MDMDQSYKIALCQMTVSDDKDENFETAARFVNAASDGGARVVCLPEIWNCPYETGKFAEYAETEDGPSVEFLSDLARENGIFLVGGSVPEAGADGKIYNTSYVFDPTGTRIAKHRKAHLFDIDIAGGLRFKESDTLSPGGGVTLFDTNFGKMGLAICFDVRFPEMFAEMAAAGAHLIFLPASFNSTTGPAHWELLLRTRALDNQLFLAACASARNPAAHYASWGHSCVTTPWGDVAGAADEREAIVYAEIDRSYADRIRREIPIGHAPTL